MGFPRTKAQSDTPQGGSKLGRFRQSSREALQLLGQEAVLRTHGCVKYIRVLQAGESGPRKVTRKQRDRSPLCSGRPFRLHSHLKTRVATPGWSGIRF